MTARLFSQRKWLILFAFSYRSEKVALVDGSLNDGLMIFPGVPNILTGLGEDQNRSTTKNIDDIVYTKPRGKLKLRLSDFPAFAKDQSKFFLTLPWPWQNLIFFFDEKTLLAYCLKYWYITWYKLALPNWTLAPSTLVAAWSTLASIESEIKPIKL